ncbi:hypothetical protein IWX90DRAFT_414817 [Phyllosticta citrichinensis]|uniref:Uncharacterized protein n=1 Tax=Phyllosticta citrichinensis TaxID=1130410 RepID=A0ABR1XT02_9PEZI
MVKLTEGPRRQPIIDILLNRCHKLNLPGQTATVHVSAHRWESALNLTDRKQDYQPTQNYQLPPGYQPQEVRPQEYFSQVHHQQIHQDIAISRAPPPQWQPPQIDHSQAWQQTTRTPQHPPPQYAPPQYAPPQYAPPQYAPAQREPPPTSFHDRPSPETLWADFCLFYRPVPIVLRIPQFPNIHTHQILHWDCCRLTPNSLDIQPQNPEGQQPQCTESIDPDPRPDDQSAYMQCRSGSNFAACP